MLFNSIGRICVRRGKTCGLFIPLNINASALKPGVYEIREVLGELTIVRIGDPAMTEARYEGLSVNELIGELPHSAMTAEEIESVYIYKNRKVERGS